MVADLSMRIGGIYLVTLALLAVGTVLAGMWLTKLSYEHKERGLLPTDVMGLLISYVVMAIVLGMFALGYAQIAMG